MEELQKIINGLRISHAGIEKWIQGIKESGGYKELDNIIKDEINKELDRIKKENQEKDIRKGVLLDKLGISKAQGKGKQKRKEDIKLEEQVEQPEHEKAQEGATEEAEQPTRGKKNSTFDETLKQMGKSRKELEERATQDVGNNSSMPYRKLNEESRNLGSELNAGKENEPPSDKDIKLRNKLLELSSIAAARMKSMAAMQIVTGTVDNIKTSATSRIETFKINREYNANLVEEYDRQKNEINENYSSNMKALFEEEGRLRKEENAKTIEIRSLSKRIEKAFKKMDRETAEILIPKYEVAMEELNEKRAGIENIKSQSMQLLQDSQNSLSELEEKYNVTMKERADSYATKIFDKIFSKGKKLANAGKEQLVNGGKKLAETGKEQLASTGEKLAKTGKELITQGLEKIPYKSIIDRINQVNKSVIEKGTELKENNTALQEEIANAKQEEITK